MLRGDELEGVLWNGPVLTLETRPVRRLGQDVLADEIDLDAAVARLRGAADRRLGEALQDQRLVAGIGNMWMAEALWEIQVSPWARVRDVSDETLRDAVAAARRLMQESLETGRSRPPDLPARGPAVPSLRHDRPLARTGRRQPDCLLVSRLPGRRRAAGGVSRTDGGTRTATASHPARLLSRRVRLPRPCARGR